MLLTSCLSDISANEYEGGRGWTEQKQKRTEREKDVDKMFQIAAISSIQTTFSSKGIEVSLVSKSSSDLIIPKP